MRIPKIQSVKTALSVYYQNPSLGNDEIRQLFGNIGKAKIAELKKIAMAEMLKDGCPVYNPRYVSTGVAYKAWGIDVSELVRRMEWINKLNLN